MPIRYRFRDAAQPVRGPDERTPVPTAPTVTSTSDVPAVSATSPTRTESDSGSEGSSSRPGTAPGQTPTRADRLR